MEEKRESKKMGESPRMSDERTRSIKGQIQQLDEDLKKATTQAAKDDIKERQDELKRQLQGMEKR